ncbi:aldo/keto reductase [Maribacter antarcticus]|uniref:aldo/keto reductase n=1 Tax=Maribacter antarcticus TaxID=505250 RepID=UPI0005605E56|nr:aldo/keto reductase [Maribacter antarcticus]
MEYRTLGRTGVNVSSLVLGTDNFMDPSPAAECERILLKALDAGINMVDTGDVYADGEGERIIGKILKETGRRDQVIIGTKVDHGQRRPGFTLEEYKPELGPNQHGHTRLNIIRACENSLKRLGTDYIDLYQLHRQSPNIPMDEILRALDDLVTSGKVRYIGCSTHPAWAVVESIMLSEMKNYVRFVSEQPPYNLLDRRIENELVPVCQKFGVGLITWAPMAMGVLAGRYTNANKFPEGSRAALRGGFYADRVTKRGIEVGIEFTKIANELGLTPAQLAVLWCKDQPGITAPLIGPRTVEQLEPLLPILEMKLTDETRAACDALVPPGSTVANFHNTADWMIGQIADS